MSLFKRIRNSISSPDSSIEPHDWKSSASFSTSKPGCRTIEIPNPAIFRNVFVPNIPSSNNSDLNFLLAYPDTSHAAVHLCLVECFYNLRRSAESYGNVFEKPPAYEEKPRTPSNVTTELDEKTDTRKWDTIIDLAITRFATWWMNIDQVFSHATAYTHHGGNQRSFVQLTKNYLPPLDVLLIWYVFMQQDDEYNLACQARNLPELQSLCFPWPAIHELIDRRTMRFSLPKAAQNLFSTMSGQNADILTYLASPPAYTESTNLPFSTINLVLQVKSLDKFVDESHELLWIRGPALLGSLTRCLQAYFTIAQEVGNINRSQRTTFEHTPFGVELMWRTHKLYPAHYRSFVEAVTQVDDDDDNDQQSKPSRAAATEKNQQLCSENDQQRSGSSHSRQPTPSTTQIVRPNICVCWTCERIRDDLPTYIHPGAIANTDTITPTTSQTSTTTTSLSTLSPSQISQIKADISFYTTYNHALVHNQPLPTRPPTDAEKAVEKELERKKKEVGYLPPLGWYVETNPKTGKRKLKQHKSHGGVFWMGTMTAN